MKGLVKPQTLCLPFSKKNVRAWKAEEIQDLQALTLLGAASLKLMLIGTHVSRTLASRHTYHGDNRPVCSRWCLCIL